MMKMHSANTTTKPVTTVSAPAPKVSAQSVTKTPTPKSQEAAATLHLSSVTTPSNNKSTAQVSNTNSSKVPTTTTLETAKKIHSYNTTNSVSSSNTTKSNTAQAANSNAPSYVPKTTTQQIGEQLNKIYTSPSTNNSSINILIKDDNTTVPQCAKDSIIKSIEQGVTYTPSKNETQPKITYTQPTNVNGSAITVNLPATLQTEGVGNIITNSGGAYYTQTKGNNILDAKINPNNYNEDKEYDNNAKDPLRGTDAKNKERKQVDDSLGKRGSKEREQQSGELHDSKKGGRNDNNKAWGDLKNGNYWFELGDKIPLIIPVLKESATKIAAVVEAKVSPIVIPKSLIDIWTRSIPGYKPKDLV